MADKKYTKLPGVHQTPVIKNFFETTVEQLFSKSKIDSISGYVGRKDVSLYEFKDTYITQPDAARDKFSLEPVVNTLEPVTGATTNRVFWSDFVNILKSYGVDTTNQNPIFDSTFYSFLPPINIDKFINYQEYFWSPQGPTAILIEGTGENFINVDKDIIGKKTYTSPSGVVFRNGMVVSFVGDFVIPQTRINARYVIEGVGSNIILHDKDQNYATSFSTEDFIPFDQTIIDSTDELIATTTDPADTRFLSGGLIGVNNYRYYASNGQEFLFSSLDQTDADTGGFMWSDFVAPAGSPLIYTVGGEGAFDVDPYDSGNTQTVPDYIMMQRGAIDNNVWSRINFWHHRQNFIDAGDLLPEKENRAIRPIIEFDRNIELYNFGKSGITSVEIAAFDTTLQEVLGRPIGASVDSVSMSVGARMIFPNADEDISPYIYEVVESTQSTIAQSVTNTNIIELSEENPDVYIGAKVTSVDPNSPISSTTVESIDGTTITLDNNVTVSLGTELIFSDRVILKRISDPRSTVVLLEGAPDFAPYTPQNFDIISVKFGSKKQGAEYYWQNDSMSWVQGQGKNKVNTPINFNVYDQNKNSLSDQLIYPGTSCNGNNIFGYTTAGSNLVVDPVLGFTMQYENFNNFSEISYTNFLDNSTISYIPFGSNETAYVSGYKYYKKIDSDGNILFDTMWRQQDKKHALRVEDRHIVNETDVSSNRVFVKISAKPKNAEQSMRVYVNGSRTTNFSYEADTNSVVFVNYEFKLNDIIDVYTHTSSGILQEETLNGMYDIPLSWHSNFLNNDIVTISSPQFTEHFYNLIKDQEDFSGDAFGSSNINELNVDTYWAQKIVQTDEDLATAAFLFSNDSFNLKDAMEYSGDEYVKFKNRLTTEIEKFINDNDVSDLSIGECLEFVLDGTSLYSQGKNVFADTYMLAHGDKKIREQITVNNVLRKEYVLNGFVDITKIENTVYVYDASSTSKDTLLIADKDYKITSAGGIITVTFTDDYVLTLGNTLTFDIYDNVRDTVNIPPTPSTLGIYPVYEPAVITDNTFQTPMTFIVGHDGSKTLATNDVYDQILMEFEIRVYNNIMQTYRDRISDLELNFTEITDGYFRKIGRPRERIYNLLRPSFNKFVNTNNLDYFANDFYDSDNELTWNYDQGNENPGHWRGLFAYLYDTETPHTTPWEMLGFTSKPSWWESEYGVDYNLTNILLWEDLENGIIRQGDRENITNNKYLKTDNSYRRIGLSNVYPISETGELLSPFKILSTKNTNKVLEWVNTTTGTASLGIGDSFSSDAAGLGVAEYTGVDTALNISSQGIINHAVGEFPNSHNNNQIEIRPRFYTIPVYTGTTTQLGNAAQRASHFTSATSIGTGAIGVAVNGAVITSPDYNLPHELDTSLHYNSGYSNRQGRDSANGCPDSNGTYGYIQPDSAVTGPQSADEHSPIVGWAFDGLPIYGPYGYHDRLNNNSDIRRLTTSYMLKQGTRDSVVGGIYSGEFLEDYEYVDSEGDLDQFNGRWGKTPEFPNGTYYYVATVDDAGQPQYPYTIGPKFAQQPLELGMNRLGIATSDTVNTPVYRVTSEKTATFKILNETDLSSGWRFGDGAPVEQAWKMTSAYPFAVAQALLLSKPGKFVSAFSKPQNITIAQANTKQVIDKDTNRRFKIQSTSIHGNRDDNGKLITATGFTQFIDCYLKFRGLSTAKEFVPAFRTINSKLGHKFAGFVDKDTMTVYSDSYSTTGNSSSLILPQEDVEIDIHQSPYSSTNDYTGVYITLTDRKTYKVSGYNNIKRFFEIEESNTSGPRQDVSVAGAPAESTNYESANFYSANVIVKSGYNFYRSKTAAPKGSSITDTTIWQRLPALPTVGGAEATLYLQGTGKILQVEYDTEFTTEAELYDFLISLGRRQKALGFSFGEFNVEINDLNDWAYSAKQFLFWSAGKWATGNTLSLSPSATRIFFKAQTGRVSKIFDVDQGQYSIVDQEGKSIRAEQCEIIRDGDTIEIAALDDRQIFGIILYTDEIEHVLLISNKTTFGDTIYSDVYNQRQDRLKIRGKRTSDWNGTLSSSGYIINNDSLLANFDTLASDMAKYNEIGHVPVDKTLYDLTRRQYGYDERKYLREFEMTFDDQYDFYAGMIRNKGTKNSLEILLNSEKVFIPGNVSIYDEWALKSGDFGDVDNYQTVDLKIDKDEIRNEKQLVSISYPEDTVSEVTNVEVLAPTTKFFSRPTLEIEPPPADIPGSFVYGGGTTATAIVNLGADGTITSVDVTDPGYGYTINPAVTVVAAELLTANITTAFTLPWAMSTSYVANNGDVTGISNVTITDHFANSAYADSVVDLSTATTVADVEAAFKDTISQIILDDSLGFSGTSTLTVSSSRIATDAGEEFLITLRGNDFSLSDNVNNDLVDILKLESKRYQPRQRYSFETANSTVYTDVSLSVDSVGLSGNIVGSTGDHLWEFDAGSRTTINHIGGRKTSGSVSYTFAPVSPNGELTDTIAADNLQIINGEYPHVDVFINGSKLPGNEQTLFSITGDSTTNTITLLDIASLPGGELKADAKIEVVEYATIDFVDAYQGDLPGRTLNIKVFANDALAARLRSIRTYEIYPDNKADATIMIDVDDADRLVTRPTDLSTNGLWPTTTAVDYSGITDKAYKKLPNSGYISKYTVDHQAWNIYDFETLFETTGKLASQIPDTDSTVHFANSEHGDFDVYNISLLEGNSYIKWQPNAGTTYLYTDFSLISDAGILDGNNTDSPADHTEYFDRVLVLKGLTAIDDYQGSLVYENGELIYSPRILSINTPVTRFSEEKLINEQAVVMSNIQFAAPTTTLISSIVPEVSASISYVEPAYTGVVGSLEIPASADIEQEFNTYSILRRAEIKTTSAPFNGSMTFSLGKGQLDGLQINDCIWIESDHPTAANISSNMYRVASIDSNNVRLYANLATLSGVADSIPRANVQFVNYGQYNFEGNANADGYSVQVYSKDHGYSTGDTVLFNVNNIAGEAGDEFKIKNATPNTFRVESGIYLGDSQKDLLTNSGTVNNTDKEVIISATMDPSTDTSVQKYLVPGGFVTFTDASGTSIDGNTYQILDVDKTVQIGNPDGQNELGDFIVTHADVYSDTVNSINGKTITLTNGVAEQVQPGMYVETDIAPTRVEEVNYKSDVTASRRMFVQAFVDFASDDYSGVTQQQYAVLAQEFQELSIGIDSATFVLNELLPTDIVIGDPVEIPGIASFDDGLTVVGINGTTITLSSPVLVKHDTDVFFKHAYPLRIDTVVFEEELDGFNIGDNIIFVEGGYNESNPGSRAISTVFSIDAPNLTASVDSDNLTFRIVNSTNVVLEGPTTGIYNGDLVKLISAGSYSGFQSVKGVDPVNNKLLFDLPYVQPILIEKTSATTVTDSDIINAGADELDGLKTGYQLLSDTATIPAETYILGFDLTGNIELSNEVSVSAGDILTFSDARWRYSTLVNSNIIITTDGEHDYDLDDSQILGKEITVADFAPAHYNWSWTVQEVPTTTTIKVTGYGFNHPYTVNSETYVSKEFYDKRTTEAFKIDGKDDRELLPFLWFNDEADIVINGAEIFKGVYPSFGVDEYIRELKRIKEAKEGSVYKRGSFGMVMPALDGFGNFSGLDNATKNLISSGIGTGHIPVNPNIGGPVGTRGGRGGRGGYGAPGRGGGFTPNPTVPSPGTGTPVTIPATPGVQFGPIMPPGYTPPGSIAPVGNGGGSTAPPASVLPPQTGDPNTNVPGGGSTIVSPPKTGAQDPIQMMYDQLGSGTMTPSDQLAMITAYAGFQSGMQNATLLPNQVLQTMPNAGYALAAQGKSLDGGYSLGGASYNPANKETSWGPGANQGPGTLSDLLLNNFTSNGFKPYTANEASQQMAAGWTTSFYAAVGYDPSTQNTTGSPIDMFNGLLGNTQAIRGPGKSSLNSGKMASSSPSSTSFSGAGVVDGLTFGHVTGGNPTGAQAIGLINKNALISTSTGGATNGLNISALAQQASGSCTPSTGLLANAEIGYVDPICTDPPPPTCPPGQHLENGVCVDDIPTCGPDQLYNTTTGQCEDIVIPPPPIRTENVGVYWDNPNKDKATTTSVTYQLTEDDSQTYTITVMFNHAGADDRTRVYQHSSLGGQRVEVGGVKASGTYSSLTNLTKAEESAFQGSRDTDLSDSFNNSSTFRPFVKTGTTGFVKWAGKFTFTYDATQGRFITFTTESQTSSHAHECFAVLIVNENTLPTDGTNTVPRKQIMGGNASAGSSTAAIIPSPIWTGFIGIPNVAPAGISQAITTNSRRLSGNPFATPSASSLTGYASRTPTNSADSNGIVFVDPGTIDPGTGIYGNKMNVTNTIVGPMPITASVPTVSGIQQIDYQKTIAGKAKANNSVVASNPYSSLKSNQAASTTPILTVTALKKDANGVMQKVGTSDMPICEPKSRIPLCPDTFSASDDPRSLSDDGFYFADSVTNDRLYGVSTGDNFKVNGVAISMTGVHDIEGLIDAINLAGASQSTNRFKAHRYTTNGATCVMLSPLSTYCDAPPISLDNGCGISGNLKEVLHYTVRGDVNHAYSESSSLAGTSTRTSSVTINMPPMTAKTSDDPPEVVANPGDFGSTNTTASGTNYIYNTITAQQKAASHTPSTITKTNGAGYRVDDVVTVVGGVPATLQEALAAGLMSDQNPSNRPFEALSSVVALKVVAGGTGYNKAGLKIIVNGDCRKKARVNYATLDVDATGAIVGLAGGSRILMRTKGSGSNISPDNSGYSIERGATSVSIIGDGEGAELMVEHFTSSPAFDQSQQNSLQKIQPAEFIVTSVDPLGGVQRLSLKKRGVYKQFPSDLDSGLPLIGGSGTGGRVFLTAHALPDCTVKSDTLSKFGVDPGVYEAPDPIEHFINTLNDYAPTDPNGFPLYTAALNFGPGGLPEVVVEGDDIDGIQFDDTYNPGLIRALNLPTGATTNAVIPEIEPVKEKFREVFVEDPDGGGPDDGGDPSERDFLVNLPNQDGTSTLGADPRTNLDTLNKGIRFSYPQAGEAALSQIPVGQRTRLESMSTPLWASTEVEGDIYEYKLTNLDGQSSIIPTNTKDRQRVDVHALESMRHATESNLDLANISHAWIDNYDGKGWAYLQNGNVIRKQEPLVDTKLIRDVFTFDEISAEKEFDVNLFDPFKGIIPGYIEKEIDYTTKSDPVVYDMARSAWGKKQIGRRWWNTNLVRYTWYEQGEGTYGPTGYNNTERAASWGEHFPGSVIRIYEWVESITPPEAYTGGGFPIETGEFIQQQFYNKTSGKATVYYYFWVYGKETVGNTARYNLQKERSTVEIERLLSDINGERVSYAGYISPDSIVVNQLAPLIKTDGSIFSTQFLRRMEGDTEKHTSWTLSAEGDPNSKVPDVLSVKLIDSLASMDALGQTVPGEGLSAFERYGSKFRPRQTMFKDLSKARKQMYDVLNSIFKELKMNTTFVDWQTQLPSDLTYLQQVDWYEKLRVNKIDNSDVFYDDTYRPLRKVTDNTKFALIKNLVDLSIIQVQKDSNSPYSLYEYAKKTNSFKLIAIENETVEWKASIYTDANSTKMGKEIREVLSILYSSVFINTFEIYWNKFFYEMMKYAYSEQGELDWAFKTTYLNIIKEETDLVPTKGFKVDNFDKALQYFNDVKPYSSKIRNYLDIKKAPVEILAGSTTDFDRPPYYDEESKEVRILDTANEFDVDILNTASEYAGFVSSNAQVRKTSTQIVFDRVKGALYENATGGKIETFRADGISSGFSFNTLVEDVTRLQVKVDGDLVPPTAFDNELISNVVGTVETVVTDAEANVFRNEGSFTNLVARSDFGTSIIVDIDIDANGAISSFNMTTTAHNQNVGDKFVLRDEQMSNIIVANTSWDLNPWDTDPNNPSNTAPGVWDEEIGQSIAPDIEFTTTELSNVSIITDRTSAINSNSTIEFTDGPIVSLYGQTYFVDINESDTATIIAPGHSMPIGVQGVKLVNVISNGVNIGNTNITINKTTSEQIVVDFDDIKSFVNSQAVPTTSTVLDSVDLSTITSGKVIYTTPLGEETEAVITSIRYNEYNDTKVYADAEKTTTVNVTRNIDYRNVSGTFGQITSIDPTINYTINTADSFLSFTNDANVNNRIGIPQNGALIELTYFEGYDPTMETINVSIAKNLVNVESNSIANISNVEQVWTAPERVYKFNPEIRQEITKAYETEYGSGAAVDANIIQNVSIVTSMIDSGKLDTVLSMVRNAVGGSLNAELVDGATFLDIVPGQHPSYVYNDALGFDVYGWDTDIWDKDVDVNNFVGIFDEGTQGNVNYRIDNETVYGFDGTTFLKHRTGPDRPEELIVVEPLETLVMDITTLGNTEISATSSDVRFLLVMDLFGRTDYYRRSMNPLTTVAQQVNNWEDKIHLNDITNLPFASATRPASVWLSGELISYTTINVLDKSISGITRGVRGTTINLLVQVGAELYNGEETENIALRNGKGEALRDPEDFNWLKPVEVFSISVPLDNSWDGSGSLSAAGLTYDSGNVSVGLDSAWDGTGDNVIEFTGSGHTLTYDIDEENGWDAATEDFKKATSLTDRGDVLKSNDSIVDFLHNFDSN